jgi:hypothetical protein
MELGISAKALLLDGENHEQRLLGHWKFPVGYWTFLTASSFLLKKQPISQ